MGTALDRATTLLSTLVEHGPNDVVGDRSEEPVSRFGLKAIFFDGQGQENLEVDLAVGDGHIGGVVDEIGVDPPSPPE